jgi:hypothetical protein
MNQCPSIESSATHLVASSLILSASALADSIFKHSSIVFLLRVHHRSMASKPGCHSSTLCPRIKEYTRHQNKPDLNHDISQLSETMTAINPHPYRLPHRPLT